MLSGSRDEKSCFAICVSAGATFGKRQPLDSNVVSTSTNLPKHQKHLAGNKIFLTRKTAKVCLMKATLASLLATSQKTSLEIHGETVLEAFHGA